MDRPPGRTSKPKLRITQVHGDQPSQIAVGPAGVWVSGGRTVWVDEPNTRRLIEIDPRTRKVRGVVSIRPSTAGSSLAVVGPVVWAATNDGVVSVDQRSRQVTATLRIPGARAIASGGSRLWVVGREGLYSVSAQKVTKHFGLSGGEGDLIAVADGAVWLSAGSSNSLRRFQP